MPPPAVESGACCTVTPHTRRFRRETSPRLCRLHVVMCPPEIHRRPHFRVPVVSRCFYPRDLSRRVAFCRAFVLARARRRPCRRGDWRPRQVSARVEAGLIRDMAGSPACIFAPQDWLDRTTSARSMWVIILALRRASSRITVDGVVMVYLEKISAITTASVSRR